MKVNVYAVLSMCVEIGVERGWNRAHKHSDTPDEHYIRQCIEDAVLHEICEYFDMDEHGDDSLSASDSMG